MRTALLLLLAVTTSALGAQTQTVWKWVDERGVTHYSDTPVPGATRMELNVSGSRSGSSSNRTPSQSTRSTPASQASTPAAPNQQVYRNFEIWRPLREETIANSGGTVSVGVRVDPALSSQHRLNLYLDGKLVEGFARNTTDFDLKDVARGMHSVVAIITDPAGTRIQETAPVVFHVRQESMANPPVGPAMRPPPKPQPRPNAANKLPSLQPSYAGLNGGRRAINPATNLPYGPKPKTDGQGSRPGK